MSVSLNPLTLCYLNYWTTSWYTCCNERMEFITMVGADIYRIEC
ncbi:hypothetical protein BDK88_2128 [Natrinema hispanicum]|uniref:Uncharacterized protein n=1 Tax=Natrinema hispanicum TaxID=392421 RepID=A0A482YDQ1_9EURY|nr:hypothetical protein BDK88_2128 [Natrinema hispanicum]